MQFVLHKEELVPWSEEPQGGVLELLGVLKMCFILGEKGPVSDGTKKEAVYVAVLVGLKDRVTV